MDDTLYSIRELLSQPWWPFKRSKTASLIRKGRLRAINFAEDSAKKAVYKIMEKDAKDFINSFII